MFLNVDLCCAILNTFCVTFRLKVHLEQLYQNDVITQCYFPVFAKILTLYNTNSMPVIFDFINDILIEILFQNLSASFVKIGILALYLI